ncbi:MAG: hypothetical protein N2747_06495 [Chitinophagaceae bacterium]|nr:hypothetical protein [Chitinophagaceae bacterium]
MFEACASTQKKLMIYQDVAHESILRKSKAKWRAVVEEFISGNGKFTFL